jgi:hypothetical protein
VQQQNGRTSPADPYAQFALADIDPAQRDPSNIRVLSMRRLRVPVPSPGRPAAQLTTASIAFFKALG